MGWPPVPGDSFFFTGGGSSGCLATTANPRARPFQARTSYSVIRRKREFHGEAIEARVAKSRDSDGQHNSLVRSLRLEEWGGGRPVPQSQSNYIDQRETEENLRSVGRRKGVIRSPPSLSPSNSPKALQERSSQSASGQASHQSVSPCRRRMGRRRTRMADGRTDGRKKEAKGNRRTDTRRPTGLRLRPFSYPAS